MRSVSVHPYVVFYRIRDEAIEIVRVVHGRRDIVSIFAKVSDVKGRPDA
jgi:plasmid stabilization system protein ParE